MVQVCQNWDSAANFLSSRGFEKVCLVLKSPVDLNLCKVNIGKIIQELFILKFIKKHKN